MKQMIKKTAIILSMVMVCTPVGVMAAQKLIVKDSTGQTDKFTVTDMGYVGIGTSAPLTAVFAYGDNYANTQIVSHYVGSVAAASGGFIAHKNNVQTTNNGLPVSGDRVGYMLFGSKDIFNADPSQQTDINAAGLGAYAEANWSKTSFPAYFAIETAGLSGARNEKMRITGAGNVGIGTKSPNATLEVNGGVRVYPVSASANTESPTLAAKPTCDVTTRGTIWFTPSATTDVMEVCAKVGGTYAFHAVTLAP